MMISLKNRAPTERSEIDWNPSSIFQVKAPTLPPTYTHTHTCAHDTAFNCRHSAGFLLFVLDLFNWWLNCTGDYSISPRHKIEWKAGMVGKFISFQSTHTVSIPIHINSNSMLVWICIRTSDPHLGRLSACAVGPGGHWWNRWIILLITRLIFQMLEIEKEKI